MAEEFDSYGFEEQNEQPLGGFGLDDVDGGLPTDDYVETVYTEEVVQHVENDMFGFDNQQEEEGTNNDDIFGLGDSTNEHASAFIAQAETENSDAYTKWEAERAKILAAKADKQRAEKVQQAATAKKELEEFYAKREATVKKNKAVNRSEEKQFKADVAETMAHGAEWEKVAKYCDLKPKQEGKGGQAPKNDRMRKLLVSLKNEGAQ